MIFTLHANVHKCIPYTWRVCRSQEVEGFKLSKMFSSINIKFVTNFYIPVDIPFVCTSDYNRSLYNPTYLSDIRHKIKLPSPYCLSPRHPLFCSNIPWPFNATSVTFTTHARWSIINWIWWYYTWWNCKTCYKLVGVLRRLCNIDAADYWLKQLKDTRFTELEDMKVMRELFKITLSILFH